MTKARRVLVGGAAALAVAAAAVAGGSAATSAPTRVAAGANADVRLNQIQVVGSHNSYHELPSPAEQELRRGFIGEGADAMTYQHQPLPYQFQSQKVRQIELDAFLDSKGGKYAHPLLRSAAGITTPLGPEMDQPGIKVLHIQDVDYESSCTTLVACLTQIENWSDANPTHAPIAILLELKDDPLDFGGLDFTLPEPWTAAAMDTLDAEIRSVMDPSDMITPDEVRGTHATLEEAVTTDGWPTLDASRGKVLFLMDNSSRRETYLEGHASLKGRVLFTNANPGDPDAAFVERNDSDDPSIPGLVKAGYVVRTRADGDTDEARTNDTAARDAAFASGAQWVSTDYPRPGMAVGFTSSYSAQIPGGTVARCNPVNAPADCTSADLDAIYTENDVLPSPPPGTGDTPNTTTTTAPGVPDVTEPTTPGAPLPAQAIHGQAGYTG